MYQQSRALSLVDSMVCDKGRNMRLERIADLIDWERIGKVVEGLHDKGEGRPAYAPVLMVKALLLGRWYNLSDPALEEALGDRISFLRFCGLSLDDPTPDHNTIWRFRNLLTERGLDVAVFDEINRQLEQRGLIIKQGTLLDATLVQAQAAAPKRDDPVKRSESTVDPDAKWTRQYGRNHFGYKAHLAVDERSGLIRKLVLTPANVYESQVADALICGDERAVYGDKAYEHKERRQRLKELGIKDRILHRSHKNQRALPYWQARRNQLIAPIRRRVERVFGTLKRGYQYRRARYFSLHRNTTELYLLAVAFNLRRAAVLMP